MSKNASRSESRRARVQGPAEPVVLDGLARSGEGARMGWFGRMGEVDGRREEGEEC